MRSLGPRHARSRAVTSGAVVFVTLVGCSANAHYEPTTVVFDSQSYTIDGPAACQRQLDGTLAINAPSSTGGSKRIRVVLTDSSRLIVKSAGVRLGSLRGFSDVSDDMWATKVDDTYTINGRMAPDDGTTTSHQFKIETICIHIDQAVVPNLPPVG